jgi:hypothetical protein
MPTTGVNAGLGVTKMMNSAQRLLAAAVLSVVGGAALAHAQATVDTLTTVPFEFSAGDTSLPRDQYRITPVSGQPGVFMLRGNREGIMVMSRVERRSDRNPAPSLTFFRYGDKYFLREVQLGDGRILQLPQARAEKEVEEYITAQAAQKSKVVIASNK